MVFEFEQLAQRLLLLQRRQCPFNHIISSNQATPKVILTTARVRASKITFQLCLLVPLRPLVVEYP